MANVLAVLLAAILHAQTTAPKIAPACASAEARQFDFWAGEWVVRGPAGKVAGTNEITIVSDGCALLERWTGAGGMSGTSLNFYDPATKQWRQEWSGGDGTILHLSGAFTNGVMTLSGRRTTPKGAQLDRITWQRREDGAVVQRWTVSADDGKTWQVVFEGTYTRKQPDRGARW